MCIMLSGSSAPNTSVILAASSSLVRDATFFRKISLLSVILRYDRYGDTPEDELGGVDLHRVKVVGSLRLDSHLEMANPFGLADIDYEEILRSLKETEQSDFGHGDKEARVTVGEEKREQVKRIKRRAGEKS